MADQVLVVDDEETVRETLAAVLTEQGYQVSTAASGADALVMIHTTEYDLILTDLRLDDFDGLRLLARVRQRWPNTVTIMLTGYASLDSAIQALRQGAYDYLCKPCPAEELLATVARGLERRRLTRQVQRHVRDLEVAIETARDLHSALAARAEGTQALLRESQSVLARTCGDVGTSARAIGTLAQHLFAEVNAQSATDVDQIRLEADRLLQIVASAGASTRTESVEVC
jgi:DNA-binding NtrC family response regulator